MDKESVGKADLVLNVDVIGDIEIIQGDKVIGCSTLLKVRKFSKSMNNVKTEKSALPTFYLSSYAQAPLSFDQPLQFKKITKNSHQSTKKKCYDSSLIFYCFSDSSWGMKNRERQWVLLVDLPPAPLKNPMTQSH